MFVSGIEISEHNQFKGFKLDLTYPEGHKKAGQPLDKVCFIGQSGTGKTTLLEEVMLIPPIMINKRKTSPVPKGDVQIKGTPPSFRAIFSINNYKEGEIYYSPYEVQEKIKHIKKNIHNLDKRIKNKEGIFSSLSLENFTEELKSLRRETQYLQQHETIFFSDLNAHKKEGVNGWLNIKNKIEAHQNKKLHYSSLISDAYVKGAIDKANRYVQELKQWQEENDTPLQDLADEYLDSILKHFNLQVKTTIQTITEAENIHLENKTTHQVIPMEHWSSGVENIISRTLPLYTHQFKNAIICVDEPENSLYPDIQRKIIDIYTKLAPDSQFFFATHSPIIASSFEPWEIVELKFNEEGYVERELYYKGENHVDNYHHYPQYLRWDAILQNVFDLENDGSEARQELLQEFSNLDTKLKARKAKGEKLSKEDPEVQQLMEMGKKLGWDTKKG
ncbi:MAG: AAA family ATPase [Aureispira sp.]